MPVKNPWWVTVVVVLGAVLMAVGGLIALLNPRMLVSPTAEMNEAVRVYAGYLVSRNLVLSIMLLAALAWRERSSLHLLLVVVGLIQFADAVLDVVEHRWPIAPGVAILGGLFFLAAWRISRAAPWRSQAWSPASDRSR